MHMAIPLHPVLILTRKISSPFIHSREIKLLRIIFRPFNQINRVMARIIHIYIHTQSLYTFFRVSFFVFHPTREREGREGEE